MSVNDMSDIHSQLQEHRYEIETLKNSHGELISTLKDTTKSMNELAQAFAVSAQKHDSNEKTLEKYGKKIDEHGEFIAAFAVSAQKHDSNEKTLEKYGKKIDEHGEFIAAAKPFIEAARSLMWKFLGANIVAVASASAIVAALSKMG